MTVGEQFIEKLSVVSMVSSLIFLLGIVASCALAFLLVRRLYHGRLRRGLPWACGFP